MSLRHTGYFVIAICALAGLLRVAMLDRQGLWVDEVFSLAMATGHSLEHPAARAEPELGDFVELERPVPPSVYRRYMEHEQPAAGPRRVVRAVLLSDTSPPLYYLLLNGWTRWAGMSDRALRLFSVLSSVACIPILAALARRLGGPRAVPLACVLFAFAPQSVYYSTEGRMYALVWLLALASAWLTLRLHRRGAQPAVLLLWVGASVAGLLTHYFFVFVWCALCFWLLVHPHRLDRRHLLLAIALTVLAVLPWYALLPRSLSTWRVTQGWLEHRPWDFNPVTAQLEVFWSYFTVIGEWYGSARVDRLLMAGVILAAGVALWRSRAHALRPRWQMLWLWVGAAGFGLLAFDLVQGTYTRAHPRYALAGLPAAFLLFAAGLARLPGMARALVMIAIVGLWVPGLKQIYTNASRAGSPIREVAKEMTERGRASDVVIVHSIPSGVLGVARYLGDPVEMASWVGQLGVRIVPGDVEALTSGRRVFLVKVHDLGEPAPQEDYLRGTMVVADERQRQVSQIIEFLPREGPPSPPPLDP